MNTFEILFVCTGNICRSPMAEYLLRERLGTTAGRVATSAGIFAVSGLPASTHAVTVLAEEGIDLRPHRSRQLTLGQVQQADLVVCMTRAHRDQILAEMPRFREKLFLMREFDPAAEHPDVADPIGGTEEAYRETAGILRQSLPGLMDFLETYPRPE